MMWLHKKCNRAHDKAVIEDLDLDRQLAERRKHLDEVKSRTPEAESVGGKAKRIVEANGFTRAIAASMEKR